MKEKKILVTGGAGFIASTLVDKLTQFGHQIVIVDNLSTGKKEYLNPKAVFYEIDICSKEVEQVFKNEAFDYVFHFAAQIDPRYSVEHPDIDNKINVFGGLNILDNCLKYKIKKIIFASTGGAVYGDTDQIPTSENFIPRPISPYGIHKLTFEKYLNYYHKVYGQRYIALRPANIYGPKQYKGGEAGVISIFIDNGVNKRKSIISGDGTQTRDFLYVDDAINAFIKTMEVDYVGEINIGSGTEKNLLQLVDAIEIALGEKIEIEHGPARLGEQMRSCLDFTRAIDILGWKPKIDLKEGIRRTVEWSRNKKQ